MTTNTRIALVISLMVNAVLFGTGAIVVLSVPALSERAAYLLPAVIVVAFVLTPFVSLAIAPRLRSNDWHRQQKQAGSKPF